jgi:hypothetical protein
MLDQLEILALLVPKVILDQLALKAMSDLLETSVPQAPRVLTVQLQDPQVQLETLALLAHKATKVTTALLALKVFRVSKAFKVILAIQVPQDHRVMSAQQVPQALRVKSAQLVHKVR